MITEEWKTIYYKVVKWRNLILTSFSFNQFFLHSIYLTHSLPIYLPDLSCSLILILNIPHSSSHFRIFTYLPNSASFELHRLTSSHLVSPYSYFIASNFLFSLYWHDFNLYYFFPFSYKVSGHTCSIVRSVQAFCLVDRYIKSIYYLLPNQTFFLF